MKIQKLLITLLSSAAFSMSASAAVLLSDDFTYTSGTLSGQGGWTATATAATPMQVSGNKVLIGTSGQDEYKAFTSGSMSVVNGNSIYSGLTIRVTAAQATGDYFFHLSNPVGTTSLFYQRLFARSSGGGFQLGMLEISGGTTTWGGGVLALNTDYRVVVGWTFVAGATNDSFKVYVDPLDYVEANNTSYLTHTWTSVTAEPTAVSAANLRQGNASNSATVTVDNLIVATTFAEAVPEPSTALSLLLGTSALFAVRRRSRRA